MHVSAVPEVPRALVDSLYDTALDSTRWESALARVASWVGGATSSLQVRDLSRGGDGEVRMFGYEQQAFDHYQTQLWHADPHLQHVANLPVLQPLLSREVVSDSALRRSVYYGEFCEPQRLHDLQGLVLMRNADWAVTLANHGAVGRNFDHDSCARLLAVGPYVLRAMSLAFDFAPRYAHVGQMDDPNLSVASVCVDAHHQLVEPLDAAMHRLLARAACPLDVCANVLRATDASTHRKLTRIIAGALQGGTRGIKLGRYQMVAVPTARRSAFDRTTCIRVIVSWSEQPSPTPADLATLPAGLREVARCMAEGMSDEEISVALQIPHATARTYAARVLRMLGVSSRRELMRKG